MSYAAFSLQIYGVSSAIENSPTGKGENLNIDTCQIVSLSMVASFNFCAEFPLERARRNLGSTSIGFRLAESRAASRLVWLDA
jgi:hypothetical protein